MIRLGYLVTDRYIHAMVEDCEVGMAKLWRAACGRGSESLYHIGPECAVSAVTCEECKEAIEK